MKKSKIMIYPIKYFKIIMTVQDPLNKFHETYSCRDKIKIASSFYAELNDLDIVSDAKYLIKLTRKLFSRFLMIAE